MGRIESGLEGEGTGFTEGRRGHRARSTDALPGNYERNVSHELGSEETTWHRDRLRVKRVTEKRGRGDDGVGRLCQDRL